MTESCFHCGDVVPNHKASVASDYLIEYKKQQHPVCCLGCKAVAEFIISSDTSSNYYELRDNAGDKVEPEFIDEIAQWEFYDNKSEFWGEENASSKDQRELYLDISGIHCSACSWLIKNKVQNLEGVEVKSIDAATGVAVINWLPEKTQFSKI